MNSRIIPSQRQAIVLLAGVVVTVLMCVALVVAAMLAPAPPAVVPLVALVCVCLPLIAAWQLPVSIAVLQSTPLRPALDERALERLRRDLDGLPETEHPLGH